MVPQEILHYTSMGCAVQDLRASVAAIMDRFPAMSLMRGLASEPGPECPCCRERTFALIVNSCGHASCEHCWLRCCEAQIEQCHSQRKMRPSCHCHAPLDADVWRVL